MLIFKSGVVAASLLFSVGLHAGGIYFLSSMPTGKEFNINTFNASGYNNYIEAEVVVLDCPQTIMCDDETVADKTEKKEAVSDIGIATPKKAEEPKRQISRDHTGHTDNSVGGSNTTGSDIGQSGDVLQAVWKVVKNPQPVYPRDARKRCEHGNVLVEIIVSPSGEIESAKIISSSGFQSLDESALNASKNIKLKHDNTTPPKNSTVIRIPYQFKLTK
jgi:TonB family protein